MVLLAPAFAATGSTLASTGEYLARAGDCAACHTVPGGKPFAGGLKMETPLGAIYSTNITPERETGIGRYSEAEFIRVSVRRGQTGLARVGTWNEFSTGISVH